MATTSGLSVFGEEIITAMVSSVGSDIGVDAAVIRSIRGPRSGFTSFRKAGFLCLMVFGDDVSNIHSDGDTIECTQPEMLGGAAAAALLQSQEFPSFIENR